MFSSWPRTCSANSAAADERKFPELRPAMWSLRSRMKYWLYLLAKVTAALGLSWLLQAWLISRYPIPKHVPPSAKHVVLPAFLHHMPFTFEILAIWMLGAGLLYLAFWDQRRRCRTCLRKLIMPLNRGSWGHLVLLGRPQTEMICPFGHGTLSIEELQITGRQYPDWHRHDDDIWKELESYGQAGK